MAANGSQWEIAFLQAMQLLASGAPDAPHRAQKALTRCLGAAKAADAPRGALVQTLRGMGTPAEIIQPTAALQSPSVGAALTAVWVRSGQGAPSSRWA